MNQSTTTNLPSRESSLIWTGRLRRTPHNQGRRRYAELEFDVFDHRHHCGGIRVCRYRGNGGGNCENLVRDIPDHVPVVARSRTQTNIGTKNLPAPSSPTPVCPSRMVGVVPANLRDILLSEDSQNARKSPRFLQIAIVDS